MKFSLWQTLCGVLSSMLLTGASAWLVFGQDKVTRGELRTYVQEQSPWVLDRGAIHVTLTQTRETLDDLKRQMAALLAAHHALAVEQRGVAARIDRILEKR